MLSVVIVTILFVHSASLIVLESVFIIVVVIFVRSCIAPLLPNASKQLGLILLLLFGISVFIVYYSPLLSRQRSTTLLLNTLTLRLVEHASVSKPESHLS